MDPHARVVSVWYRTAGLASRNQKDLAVEIIEAEIRSARQEVWLEAAKLVLAGEPVEIASYARRQKGRFARVDGLTPDRARLVRHRFAQHQARRAEGERGRSVNSGPSRRPRKQSTLARRECTRKRGDQRQSRAGAVLWSARSRSRRERLPR